MASIADKKKEKRLRRKANKKANQEILKKTSEQLKAEEEVIIAKEQSNKEKQDANAEDELELEYVAGEVPDEIQQSAELEHWQAVFEHFNKGKQNEQDSQAQETAGEENDGDDKKDTKPKSAVAVNEDGEEILSNKKRKLLNRLSVAELKQLVEKPDVVETWDVTAADPKLLVHLKSYRNTVPVPRHWCNKRKYLQGKRGVEKPAFQLPDFIANTGIGKIRQAYQEKEDAKTLKQKQRERMAPKQGRMDIDYNILHDAFFRFQTKPKMVSHGVLYYEGKEMELHLKDKRPGFISDDLRAALGMPSDESSFPPPWVRKMQLHGPPPAYPGLKIPGVNAPIPPGAQWGLHFGGWGKPPVDEYNRPLYGDVFGAMEDPAAAPKIEYDRTMWGELVEEEYEESEEEEEEDAEEEGAEGEMPPPPGAEIGGEVTPSGSLSSALPSGMVTPGHLELRKGLTTPSEAGGTDSEVPELYKELRTEEASSTGMMGSSFKYVIAGDKQEQPSGQQVEHLKGQYKGQEVAVALDPSEMEGADEELLKEKFEDAVRDNKRARADVAEVFSDESAKKKKKTGKAAGKKNKDFRF